MTKFTKQEMFAAISDYLQYAAPDMDSVPRNMNPEDFLDEAIRFCDNEVALIVKRKAAPRKATATQRENAGIKQDIVQFLNTVPCASATVIANDAGISVQKASALLRQLVADEYVRRVPGKTVMFTVYDPE